MEAGLPGSNQSTNTSGASPSSNASNLSATVVSASAPARKKQGRGPGKKDVKDRPTVSVRWDDADLTDRLIGSIESNERWQGVFAQSSNEPSSAVKTSAPVAKRDLQREIARHLFQSDPRYDLNDRKVLESLAVSVKNKLFKLTTLYSECKHELGHFHNFKDERDIAPGSELASAWARVKEKFPQFMRIRDLMNRVSFSGTPRTSVDPLSPVLERSPTVTRQHSMTRPQLVTNTSNTAKGMVEIPRDVYLESGSSYMPSGTTMVGSPTYPSQSPIVQSTAFVQSQPGQNRRPSGSVSQYPSTSRTNSAAMNPPQTNSVHRTAGVNNSRQRAAPYRRPSTILPSTDHDGAVASPRSPDAGPPSPPLTQSIQHIVSTLSEKKEKEQARAHELQLLRMQREEAERVRWHQREMLRLRIQLIRAERSAGLSSSTTLASSTPASGLPLGRSGPGEDELAMAAGIGDDGASMEGDGEGELDDEMYDPAPLGSHLHSNSNSVVRPIPPPLQQYHHHSTA